VRRRTAGVYYMMAWAPVLLVFLWWISGEVFQRYGFMISVAYLAVSLLYMHRLGWLPRAIHWGNWPVSLWDLFIARFILIGWLHLIGGVVLGGVQFAAGNYWSGGTIIIVAVAGSLLMPFISLLLNRRTN